ncbi:histidine phosphatase family protein [Alisedimentitalea sp. MJ-SS2]|uniref:histidine phosphatase family protein n=1 Tax=Aliisedimentitalea sp. MJ-SS2 TaxID=3049795 RepID=UPI002914309A|nr:histidine phosphatase family protein [Alisedimentitalea sp. MJ-SS2]MDU8927602.1 histidine phosphatase family protein [Alisedimentitalea sp. MJ-SS2]
MPHITLVRHGQANSMAKDETGYDKLSDLGHQQARWLGEHIDATGERFARVYSGTLRRQVETAQSMGAERHAPLVQDARLNELSYFAMAQMMQDQHGLPIPETREGYVEHLPQVFGAWERNEIADPPESYADFTARIDAMLDEITASNGRALLVTSGGVIATILRRVLNLDLIAWSHVALSIMNSSVHRLHVLHGYPTLAHFNAIPHLEHRDRQFAQTHL